MKQAYPDSVWYNLLYSDLFYQFQRNPSSLRRQLRANPPGERPVIIDEIQKLPKLLDEIQALIDEDQISFILTGSSARKLKAGGANLLGGRARFITLHPFAFPELTASYPEMSPMELISLMIQRGTLPPIWLSDDPHADLLAYCGAYLKEEIQAEAVVRKLDNFSRFLGSLGTMNSQELNYEEIARDCSVPPRTVREYLGILEDTLIAQVLEPWKAGRKRKSVSRGKLYFFDHAVARTLAGSPVATEGTSEWGRAFEAIIYQELRAYISYQKSYSNLTYWRTIDQREVDFILDDSVAIEIKASSRIHPKDLKGLRNITEEGTWKHRILVCTIQKAELTDEGILVLPVEDFLTRLWSGQFD